ncbi:hypothetical protein [Aequorivita ciconiae]|nr:hypothetical protein [Aequorivita sp. H23M31]
MDTITPDAKNFITERKENSVEKDLTENLERYNLPISKETFDILADYEQLCICLKNIANYSPTLNLLF